jgi:hypothetical protein
VNFFDFSHGDKTSPNCGICRQSDTNSAARRVGLRSGNQNVDGTEHAIIRR